MFPFILKNLFKRQIFSCSLLGMIILVMSFWMLTELILRTETGFFFQLTKHLVEVSRTSFRFSSPIKVGGDPAENNHLSGKEMFFPTKMFSFSWKMDCTKKQRFTPVIFSLFMVIRCNRYDISVDCHDFRIATILCCICCWDTPLRVVQKGIVNLIPFGLNLYWHLTGEGIRLFQSIAFPPPEKY